MQNYKTVKETDSIQSSRDIFNNAITSAVSNNSGTAFPTENLVVGMKCYRTDLGKTYTLTDVANKTWKEDSHAELADSATKLATARTISLTGKATGSATFDGSANASINVTAVKADSCTGNAATASAVAWSGITGKPSTYTPATHNHDTSYPSTSGSRATGTWGINVTGTAANVTQKKSATAVSHTDYNNNQGYVPDMSFLSYWNGAYSSGNSSNLKYCANGTIIGSNNIGSQSVNYATSAKTASYPSGFSANSTSSATWGNQTGSAVADWSDGAGGDIQFRKNNPVSGQLSVLVDGLFYQREGKCACIDTSTISSQSVKYATSAGSVAWGNVTGKPSTYTPASHTHGLGVDNFAVTVSSTTDSWDTIGGNNKFLLKSIRTESSYPNWLCGNYASGIAFGGSDTKGVLSVAYNTPSIKFAGGNGTKPAWWINVTGTSGNSYNLANFPTKTGTGASGTWGINVTGSSASCTGNAKTASAVAWSGVTSKPASIVKVSSWDGSTLKLTTCT